MSAKTIDLLLLDNVENLGIVGDVVSVKNGYARNYLLPHGLATLPSKKRIEELKERRIQVQGEMKALRSAREELHGRMEEIKISIIRSCNDQGALYGSVSQRDISEALQENGYDVGLRSIRVGQAIRRVGEYPIPIQFDKDLRCEIILNVEPDHPIGEEREEMEFDNEGDLIEKRPDRKRPRRKRDDDDKKKKKTEDTETKTEETAQAPASE